MVAKRIIPCLDVRDGRTVKGVYFEELKDVGDPAELGARYSDEGADELVFFDITASHEGRKTFVNVVERIADRIDIPFTVGGGVQTVDDVGTLLNAGADKVTINSAAVNSPELITDAANHFGNQCIVVAIDTRRIDGVWRVYTHGGRKQTDLKTHEWAIEAVDRGAGELLVTSMEHDGARSGYAVELTADLAKCCQVPIIASGGAGSMEHFSAVLQSGGADAALAASFFHMGEIEIPTLKSFLLEQGIEARR